jgi:hypothetical protein
MCLFKDLMGFCEDGKLNELNFGVGKEEVLYNYLFEVFVKRRKMED